MDTPNGEYTVVGQKHLNALTDAGTVVPGYEISVRDNQSGVSFPVFCPDDRYSADNVRLLIVNKLGHIRSVHALTS